MSNFIITENVEVTLGATKQYRFRSPAKRTLSFDELLQMGSAATLLHAAKPLPEDIGNSPATVMPYCGVVSSVDPDTASQEGDAFRVPDNIYSANPEATREAVRVHDLGGLSKMRFPIWAFTPGLSSAKADKNFYYNQNRLENIDLGGSSLYLLNQQEVVEVSTDEFDLFHAIFNIQNALPSTVDRTQFNQRMQNSVGAGFFFQVITDYYAFTSIDSPLRAAFSLGRSGVWVEGRSQYFTFSFTNRGKVHLVRTSVTSSGEVRRELILSASMDTPPDDKFTVNACVLIVSGRVFVILSSQSALEVNYGTDFPSLPDFSNIIAKLGSVLMQHSPAKTEYGSLGKNTLYILLSRDHSAISTDVTFYGSVMWRHLVSGFPLRFLPKARLPFAYHHPHPTVIHPDLWSVKLRRFTGELQELQFFNGTVADRTSNTTFKFKLWGIEKNGSYTPITTDTQKYSSVVGFIEAEKTELTDADKYIMHGFHSVAFHDKQIEEITYTSPVTVTLPTSLITGIRVERGHYNANNSCELELMLDTQDSNYTSQVQQVLSSLRQDITVKVNGKLVFTGINVIDESRISDIIMSLTDRQVARLQLRFEEDWLRMLKENSVIVPESLGQWGPHALALKRILVDKIAIPEDHFIYENDGVPLPFVVETETQNEYVMVIGRDFYSYVDNIVGNFSGWVLYRDYALSDLNNDPRPYIRYHRKPMFMQGVSPYAVFYTNQAEYDMSTETRPNKVLGNLTVRDTRPMATSLLFIRPNADFQSAYQKIVYRSETIYDSGNSDYIGYPIQHVVVLPYLYAPNASLDPLERELILRYLYGRRLVTFTGTMEQLSYYYPIQIAGLGMGVISKMTFNISPQQMSCNYEVTMEKGGIAHQW